ncbi:MAG: hypothetical protein IJU50_07540, partial [Lachnospiraceae bacterium]|nr:hypothetical protein [Lachnospiraceae bacterium]
SNKGKVSASKTATGKAAAICTYDPYKVEGVDGTGFTNTTIIYVEDVKLKAESGLVEKKAGANYTLEMSVGEQYVLQSTGASQPVVFASGKPAVAFVDEAGVVYARGNGAATLSARVNGKKISVKVTVK